MVKLRFKRVGAPKQPHFRLVAIDSRRARNGGELEILGHYDPRASSLTAEQFKAERIRLWLSRGAQMSDTARTVLFRAGVPVKAAAVS